MFTLAGQALTLLEMLAFVSGLLSVWLAQRLHIANWPAGMLSVLCLSFVFLDAKLYADGLLQLALLVLSGYGWWRWARTGSAGRESPVTRSTGRQILFGLALAAAATWAGAKLLIQWTDSPVPWPDAAILAFSLLALAAQAHRRIECWLVWIAVDLVAISLYWSRSLPLTAALYVLFLLLCVGGWVKWARRLRLVQPSSTNTQ